MKDPRREDAMTLGGCSMANIVDPAYTVIAKFPKRYLPR